MQDEDASPWREETGTPEFKPNVPPADLPRWRSYIDGAECSCTPAHSTQGEAEECLDRQVPECGTAFDGRWVALVDTSKPQRGGPRPGFGGAQPNAGRKAGPVTDRPVTVAIILTPELARKLDLLRGETQRAAWFRQKLEDAE